MVTIFDVAAYILEKVTTITSMKLHRLLYYSQAWSLVWEETPLFDNDFQAWASGAVCPELFHAHRGHYSIATGFFSGHSNDELSDNQKEIVDKVLEYYGDKSAQWLSELTQLERPWKETRSGLSPGERSELVIPKELMQDYYAGL